MGAYERGNKKVLDKVYSRASMGPRSHERGNSSRKCHMAILTAGFNGAAFS